MSLCGCWQLTGNRQNQRRRDGGEAPPPHLETKRGITDSGNGQVVMNGAPTPTTRSTPAQQRSEEAAVDNGNAVHSTSSFFAAFKRKGREKRKKQDGGGLLVLGSDEVDTAAAQTGGGGEKEQKPPPLPRGKLPAKKVSFSWNNSQRRHDSYEYIDEDVDVVVDKVVDRSAGTRRSRGEAVNDDDEEEETDGYSKFEDSQSQHRYDYPTFLASSSSRAGGPMGERFTNSRRGGGGTAPEEQFYTSASQTYSLGSEDPYSSIISVGERQGDESSGIYEPGYSRIRNRSTTKGGGTIEKPAPSNELEALYAKIHRRPPLLLHSSRKFDPHQQPSTSAALLERNAAKLPLQPSRSTTMFGSSGVGGVEVGHQQEAESGSGSVTSGSQPSYRYLTVRESPRTIRERIRRREEEAAAANNNNARAGNNNENSSGTSGRAEHFYSEINEYESLGSESLYDAAGSLRTPRQSADTIPPSEGTSREKGGHRQTSATNGGHHQQPSTSSHSMDTLRVLLYSPTNGGGEPPRPPTSPIPKPQPPVPQPPPLPMPMIRRPLILHSLKHQSGIGAVTNTESETTPAVKKVLSSAAPGPTTTTSNGACRSPSRDFHSHMRAVLQPLWNNGGHLIMGNSGKKQQQTNKTATEMELTARECGAKQPNRTSFSEFASFATGHGHTAGNHAEAGTQTMAQPPSRIPLPVGGAISARAGSSLRTRTPSPSQDAAVQTTAAGGSRSSSRADTAGAGGRHSRRNPHLPMSTSMTSSAGPPPLPSGRDYISPIDLSTQRGWPLSVTNSFEEE